MSSALKVKKAAFGIDSQGCGPRDFISRPERPGRFPAVIVSHGTDGKLIDKPDRGKPMEKILRMSGGNGQ